MNAVDSSGWLEYLSAGPKSDAFEGPLRDTDSLIVPVICLYEVFKVVLRERGEQEALQAAALMKQGKVIEVTETIALQAAQISNRHKLPMADSLILATARACSATLWTMDSDFKDLDGVKHIR